VKTKEGEGEGEGGDEVVVKKYVDIYINMVDHILDAK